jgi:hypothetical protein
MPLKGDKKKSPPGQFQREKKKVRQNVGFEPLSVTTWDGLAACHPLRM